MGARKFKPQNRLANVLNGGGMTAEELIRAAEARVTALQPTVQNYVAERLKLILRFATVSDDVLFSECQDLGREAMAVAEVAGAGGMETVGEIARGISAMIDSLKTNGVWHTEALRVHLNALLLVSQSRSADPSEGQLILQRLQQMRTALEISE